MRLRSILWLLFCLIALLVGSAIIAVVCYALHLPAPFGTFFGMILGFALFIFYMDKMD